MKIAPKIDPKIFFLEYCGCYRGEEAYRRLPDVEFLKPWEHQRSCVWWKPEPLTQWLQNGIKEKEDAISDED